ncbi:MAG: DUF1800 domain-containing protein [Planctomycetes bacterium]|nr:DUF1800 domain-containing protein [Planctomycetota bacterium]
MLSSAILLLLAPLGGAPQAALAWDARRAEHLLNRASFGANTRAIERAVALGPEALVDELLRCDAWVEEPFYSRKRLDGEVYRRLMSVSGEAQYEGVDRQHAADRAQSQDFVLWWVERILAARDPLRERMVLFWHGHFTSSLGLVKSSYEMIQQNQLFRRLALGNFRELLHQVAHDPAMLLYLDSDSSRKEHPNENFARELLELYTLGEGNYSEQDVGEVARAFTGWSQADGRFYLNPKRHDEGAKHVLGVELREGDEVLEVVLAQAACARHIARALLSYFEGLEPAPERLERYAAGLRADWRIDSFLRRLFLDPDFYRDEACASRVSSPLDYLVGAAQRLGVTPPPSLAFAGAALLGQRLFFPPTVRGWEGGDNWTTSASLVLRGSLAGVLLGRVPAGELLGATLARGSMEESMEGLGANPLAGNKDAAPEPTAPRRRLGRDVAAEVRLLDGLDWLPRLNLTQRFGRAGPPSDEALARALLEEVLAIPAPPALVTRITERLARERLAQGLGSEPWTSRPEQCEPLLRELAHAVLCLPEAQLD